MCVLIPIDVTNFLHGTCHLLISPKIIEKHEPTVKINSLQNIVCNHRPHECFQTFLSLKFIVQISDKFIPTQQMRIIFPLIQHFISLLRLTDRIQHITITLTVYCLLKCLNRQAQIYFICCNIFADVRQIRSLNTVQKYKK